MTLAAPWFDWTFDSSRSRPGSWHCGSTSPPGRSSARASLAAVAYLVCMAGFGWGIWPATLASFTIAFLFRYTAMLRHWEEPEPWEPEELRAEKERPRIQDMLREEFRHDKP